MNCERCGIEIDERTIDRRKGRGILDQRCSDCRVKQLKEYLRAFSAGKEIERLTIINWLEEVEQIDAFGDTDVAGIINALKEEIHKRRD